MECLLCTRHCVKCVTCINSFDCSLIKCLLKEYPEASPTPSAQGWFQRRLVGKEETKIFGEKQMLVKFIEIFIQEAREIG